MASTKQVALARPNRPPTQFTPAPRIPAFLDKLYEMVNDPETNELIKWSDSGDSFYVYDQVKFARELLPHWFKHQNFASFVRQLNMYGFHKIPHLQQGVLKSKAGSEHWNFVHPNFRRDQHDLLCYIQRKKSTTAAEDEREAAALPAANAQVLDIHGIVNGIAAIQRHQTAISAELSDLKRNNELLWQETQAARARHQKQQDTINRIVKFLAGVFASHGSPVHKEDVRGSPSPRSVVPRRQSRLMIENGSVGSKGIDEVDSPAQFATIETPSAASPMESPREPVSPQLTPVAVDSPAPAVTSLPPDDSSNNVISTQPQYPQAPSNGALSTLSQADMQHIMNTMKSMNSINIPSMPAFPGGSPELQDNPDSSLTSYQAPLDFSQFSAEFPLIPSPPQSASLLDLEKIDPTWRSTDDITQDVESVDNKINNLIHQFHFPADGSVPFLDLDNSSASIADLPNPPAIENDELFHSFFNGVGNEDGGVFGDEDNASTAFLDEVPASDGSLSPVTMLHEELPSARTKTGKKRKSDAVASATVVDQATAPSPETKAKRRRER
ncbi:Transcriptional factor [Mycena sanguinolenta]|uniref:Transcriptional factor n=1 Tax=Mycena sanguinolenta TaxID=230812 RepID=A0A8H7D4V8_9AGAR|nr:Transcriptional factor [Mycena sanguinolenta]